MMLKLKTFVQIWHNKKTALEKAATVLLPARAGVRARLNKMFPAFFDNRARVAFPPQVAQAYSLYSLLEL